MVWYVCHLFLFSPPMTRLKYSLNTRNVLDLGQNSTSWVFLDRVKWVDLSWMRVMWVGSGQPTLSVGWGYLARLEDRSDTGCASTNLFWPNSICFPPLIGTKPGPIATRLDLRGAEPPIESEFLNLVCNINCDHRWWLLNMLTRLTWFSQQTRLLKRKKKKKIVPFIAQNAIFSSSELKVIFGKDASESCDHGYLLHVHENLLLEFFFTDFWSSSGWPSWDWWQTTSGLLEQAAALRKANKNQRSFYGVADVFPSWVRVDQLLNWDFSNLKLLISGVELFFYC